MLVLYMTRVTTASGSYVTHGSPFELKRILKTSATTAEYCPVVGQRHMFSVTRMRSWVVSARVPHECDVARCASAARARRAWPRVATALAAYTFLVTRLNADLARLVLARLVTDRTVTDRTVTVDSLGSSGSSGSSVPVYGANAANGQIDESSETSARGGTSAIDAMIT
jgi:hypothetical protein